MKRISVMAGMVILYLLAAIILPACGLQIADFIPVDTPAALQALGYPSSMSLVEAREAYQYWKAEVHVTDLIWSAAIADGASVEALVRTLLLQAVESGQAAAGGLTGGSALLVTTALGAVAGWAQKGTSVKGEVEALRQQNRGLKKALELEKVKNGTTVEVKA